MGSCLITMIYRLLKQRIYNDYRVQWLVTLVVWNSVLSYYKEQGLRWNFLNLIRDNLSLNWKLECFVKYCKAGTLKLTNSKIS